jgi:hypothetical protein
LHNSFDLLLHLVKQLFAFIQRNRLPIVIDPVTRFFVAQRTGHAMPGIPSALRRWQADLLLAIAAKPVAIHNVEKICACKRQ